LPSADSAAMRGMFMKAILAPSGNGRAGTGAAAGSAGGWAAGFAVAGGGIGFWVAAGGVVGLA
jgi:hypothetical protein